MKAIPKRDLETLVKARLAAGGQSRPFDIHGLRHPDENGCNWHLMAQTVDGWKPLDLISETSEDVLQAIHAELSRDYNLKLPDSSA